MAEYRTTYNKGGTDYDFQISVNDSDQWNVCATPAAGGETLCSILGESSNNTTLIPSTRTFIEQSLLREFYPKKLIIVGDSIWDRGNFNTWPMIEAMCQQLNIQLVYFNVQASMNSTEWVNGETPATMQDAIDNCVGEEGADTLVFMALGINDIDYENKVYDWDTDFAQQKLLLKSNVQLFLDAKPKVKMFWVSAPATAIQSFNDNYERMICEIASEQGYPWYSGYQAMKGVRPAFQYSNNSSAFYIDGVHPNEIGLMRFWNYLMIQIVPTYHYRELILTQYANPVQSPDDQPSYTVINNGWSNTVTNGQLEFTDNPDHYCFAQHVTIPGQLVSVKFPDASLMGNFRMAVKWVIPSENKLYNNEEVVMPPSPDGSNEYVIEAPDNVGFLCVNISDDPAFFTAYQADPTIAHLKMNYSRSTYEAPIQDIMMGFPQTIFDYTNV